MNLIADLSLNFPQRLARVNERDSQGERVKRWNQLNSLQTRVGGWLTALEEQKAGPSVRQMAMIVEDLRRELQEMDPEP